MVAGERSIAIRTLEEELGTPLFVRTTCRVEPTQAGQLFAEFAQSTRKGYEAFQAALAAGQRQREKLVLQVPATMAARDPLYHDLLLALSRELPDCDLEVITDSACRPPRRHPARDPDTKDPCSRRARPCRGGRQIVNGKYRKSTATQYDFAAIIERAQPPARPSIWRALWAATISAASRYKFLIQ